MSYSANLDKNDFWVGDHSADDLTRSGSVEKLEDHKRILIRQAQNILTVAQDEKRGLNNVEESEFNSLSNQIQNVQNRISTSRENRDRIAKELHRSDVSVGHFTPEWRAIREGRPTRFGLPVGEQLQKISDRRSFNASTEFRDLLTSNVSAVPTQILNELIMRMVQTSGVLASNPRTLTTGQSGNGIKVPIQTAYGTASFVSEGSAFPESDSAHSSVTLNAYKLGNLLQVSQELIFDSEFDLAPFLGRELGTQIGVQLAAKLINGSGTAEPEGILQSASTGVTGTASAPTIANVMSLYASLPTQYRETSSFILAPATYAALVNLNDTTGRSLILGDLSSAQPMSLMGRPVFLDSNMPATGSGNKSVWFGALDQYLIIRYAGDVAVDSSDAFAFDKDLITYRSRLRVDSKCVNTDAARVFVGA
jgi:HK97 family phage major capsid protein